MYDYHGIIFFHSTNKGVVAMAVDISAKESMGRAEMEIKWLSHYATDGKVNLEVCSYYLSIYLLVLFFK